MLGRGPSLDTIARHIATRNPPTLSFRLGSDEPKEFVLIQMRVDASLQDHDGEVMALLWGHEANNPSRVVELHYSVTEHYAFEAGGQPISKLAFAVLQQAVEDGASKVMLSTNGAGVSVSFLIDDSWQQVMRVPKNLESALFSRFRVLADLDGAFREKRGLFVLGFHGKGYEFVMTETSEETQRALEMEIQPA